MQIDKQHWKICARCDKSWDDDGAFYCDHQEKCTKIEVVSITWMKKTTRKIL